MNPARASEVGSLVAEQHAVEIPFRAAYVPGQSIDVERVVC